MQKTQFFKSPFGIAALICFAIAVVSPFIFVDSQSSQKAQTVKKEQPTATISLSQSEENEQSVQGATSYNQVVTPTVSVQATTSSSTITSGGIASSGPTATPTNQPTSAPAVQTFQVNLKISGASVGSVDVQEGNNQCDVLSRAKDQGKLSQLLMKYDNSLGTNGVYQINGTGKDTAVWWVYKVNGASPTQGCSFIKANSGDTVEWEYKG